MIDYANTESASGLLRKKYAPAAFNRIRKPKSKPRTPGAAPVSGGFFSNLGRTKIAY